MRVRVVCSFSLALCMPLAVAQTAPDHWLRPFVDVSWSWDANLFKVEDARVPPDRAGLSDSFRTITTGLVVERQISNQGVNAHIKVASTHFDRFKEIDYDSRDVGATWNWQLGRRLRGAAGISSSQSLNSFAESRLQEKNLRTNRREFFSGVWRFHPDWQVQFGTTRNRNDFELASQNTLNRDIRTNDLSLDYLSGNGSRIGLQLVRSDAVFPVEDVRLPPQFRRLSDYTQDDIKLRVDWNLSGKSAIRFSGGKTGRTHQVLTERDFNGFNARVVATWAPTAKQALTLNAWREIGAVDNLITNYTLNQGVSLDSIWAPNEKLRFDGRLSFEIRDYNGIAGIDQSRSDQYHVASLGMTYTLFRRLQLGLSASRESLNSNQAARSYRTNGFVANLRYQY